MRLRHPGANCLRNAPEWTDKYFSGVRSFLGYKDDDAPNGVTYIRERPITGSTAEANYELVGRIHATPAAEWPACAHVAAPHKYAEVIIGATPVAAIQGVLIHVPDPAALWKYLEGGAGVWAPVAYCKLASARQFARALRQSFPREFQDRDVPIAVVMPAPHAAVVRRRRLSNSVAETRVVGAALRVVELA